MYQKVNLDDWTLFSDRRNSQNYISKDGKWMLKVFTEFAGNSLETLEAEQELSRSVAKLGIPTPAVGDIVEMPNGGYGLIFEYVTGKRSFARAMHDEPENVEKYTKNLVALLKKIHSMPCDTERFPSSAEACERMIKTQPFFTDAMREKMLAFLATIEPKTTCIHGDCNPSNFIMSDQGEFAIDLGMFKYGNPLFDIGMTAFFICLLPPLATEQIFRINPECQKVFWHTFVCEYFDITDEAEFREKEKFLAKMGYLAFAIASEFIDPGDDVGYILSKFDEVYAE